MSYPSKLIEDAVNEFASLPGIGKKTALRLVLHLLKQEPVKVQKFGEAVTKMRRDIKFCSNCHNVSDGDTCSLCRNPARDDTLICVVESIRDVMAIENIGQYNGLYHVLGGVISPVDGIGPDDIEIESLMKRIDGGEIEELMMALNPTMEGDTTIFYISKRLAGNNIRITTIARGVAFGGELEYTDETTLARSIATRLPYENYLVKK
ncbi:MAG: recombination protein RecR [Chitinophagales bacterium]|nr:recombination protein RecR [Chitinophagales bacterium]